MIAATASTPSRKRQRGRPLELGATCLLLGVLLGDTPIIRHEFGYLSRAGFTGLEYTDVFFNQVGKHSSFGLLDILFLQDFSSGSEKD